jgi:multiple sugar transport system permease protein
VTISRRTATKRLLITIRYTALVVLAALFLLPIYVMVKTAVSQPLDVASKTFIFWPSDPTFEKFVQVATDPQFTNAMLTSTVMAVVTTIGQIAIGASAGYALARLRSRASKPLLAVTLVMLLIPSATTFLPNFLIVSQLGWVNTFQGLIVPTLFAAFNVFLFRQFYLSFPVELEEAGRLDGLGHIGTFVRIVAPNTLAFASALTVLSFIGAWNSFLWPLVVGSTGNVRTIQVYLSSFLTAQSFDFTGLFAAGLLAVLPIVVVFVFLQRWLVRGVAETGIGGQ